MRVTAWKWRHNGEGSGFQSRRVARTQRRERRQRDRRKRQQKTHKTTLLLYTLFLAPAATLQSNVASRHVSDRDTMTLRKGAVGAKAQDSFQLPNDGEGGDRGVSTDEGRKG